MPTKWINILNIWAHASNGRDTPGHWEYKGYYLDEEDDTNRDDTLMKVVTSYLSPTRTLVPTEPVVELSVPTAFRPILEEVENETGANLGFKSADDTFDNLEMANSIQWNSMEWKRRTLTTLSPTKHLNWNHHHKSTAIKRTKCQTGS
jgi:hypothetical protein